MFFVLNAWATNFRVDGINYLITSDSTVGVCRNNTFYINDIIIPDSVSYLSTNYSVNSICDSAFFKCSGLTSIRIPTSVTTIGNIAFYNCTSLTSLLLSNKVENIGNYAFYNCTGLKNITISNLNAKIGQQTFYLCTGLLSASINAKTLGKGAFGGCTSLTSVTFGKSLTNIDDDTFMECFSLVGIKVDELNPFLTDIDGVLFSKDKKIVIVYPNAKGESYIIPDGVDSIASCAFETCSKLKTLVFPISVTAIGESAFYCDSSLISIILPPKINYLYPLTFKGCVGLTSIIIPDSVKGMGQQVFMDCESLASVQFPSSLTNIGYLAFDNCNELTTLNIPPSVTTINGMAFSSLKLTTINVNNATPPVIYSSSFFGVRKSTCILNVPIGSKAAYQADNQWKLFRNIIEKDFSVSVSGFKQQGLKIYSGFKSVNIQSDEVANISIFSVCGNEVISSRLNIGNNHIGLSRGIYLVKVNDLISKVLIQ